MYDYLEGTVASQTPAGVVLDVGGVGYQLSTPLGTSFPASPARVRVWTHLAVREDAHTLYGFADAATRDAFRTLLRVKGVGPRAALAVLSGLNRAELCRAIQEEDLARLTAIKGVGKKTGEQILLDLRDRIGALSAGLGCEDGLLIPASAPSSPSASGQLDDAVSALCSLGFSEKEAKKRIERALVELGDEEAADIARLVQTAFRG